MCGEGDVRAPFSGMSPPSRLIAAGVAAVVGVLAVCAVLTSDGGDRALLLDPAKAAAHARLEGLVARDHTPSALQSLDPVSPD